MAYDLLGLPPWLFTVVMGGWFLLTGRDLIPWVPAGVREGWRLRLVGLVWCLVGAFFTYQVINGSFSPEAIAFSYVGLGLALWRGWRKARTQERAGQ
ncbi:MAG TPA: hypothetical protein VIJ58_09045 [Candidatus Dormibacteraeota bacterium]